MSHPSFVPLHNVRLRDAEAYAAARGFAPPTLAWEIIVDMHFKLALKTDGFVRFLAAMKRQDTPSACIELLDSDLAFQRHNDVLYWVDALLTELRTVDPDAAFTNEQYKRLLRLLHDKGKISVEKGHDHPDENLVLRISTAACPERYTSTEGLPSDLAAQTHSLPSEFLGLGDWATRVEPLIRTIRDIIKPSDDAKKHGEERFRAALSQVDAIANRISKDPHRPFSKSDAGPIATFRRLTVLHMKHGSEFVGFRVGWFRHLFHKFRCRNNNVWKAVFEATGIAVVLKRMRPKDIKKELVAARKIRSPFVCLIFGAYKNIEDPHIETFVFPFVPGGNMDHWLCTHGSDTAAVTRVLWQIAQGLLAVHEAGISHRDVKGANIVMSSTDRDAYPLLIDFEFCKEADHDPNALTRVIVGTPGYEAPEICEARRIVDAARGRELNSRELEALAKLRSHEVDVYAFGIVMKTSLQDGGDDTARFIATCLRDEPNERPSMSEIVDWLSTKVDSKLELERDLNQFVERERRLAELDDATKDWGGMVGFAMAAIVAVLSSTRCPESGRSCLASQPCAVVCPGTHGAPYICSDCKQTTCRACGGVSLYDASDRWLRCVESRYRTNSLGCRSVVDGFLASPAFTPHQRAEIRSMFPFVHHVSTEIQDASGSPFPHRMNLWSQQLTGIVPSTAALPTASAARMTDRPAADRSSLQVSHRSTDGLVGLPACDNAVTSRENRM